MDCLLPWENQVTCVSAEDTFAPREAGSGRFDSSDSCRTSAAEYSQAVLEVRFCLANPIISMFFPSKSMLFIFF